LKNIGAKVIAYNIDREEIRKNMPAEAPPIFENILLFGKAFEIIISLLSKDETKYDYYVFDSFFDVKEMNKIFKIPLDKFVLISVSYVISDENYLDLTPFRRWGFKELNEKYNLNFHEFVEIHYTPNKFKKLILTSKLFHYKSEKCDDTCYFIGPNIEKRKFDENFKFQKDKSKKLIYISCGTIFNVDIDFFKTCIEAFRDSDEYQLLITVGQYLDLKVFQDVPKNVSIFNYVPNLKYFQMWMFLFLMED
jgi:MGT family glycosyltransferase